MSVYLSIVIPVVDDYDLLIRNSNFTPDSDVKATKRI